MCVCICWNALLMLCKWCYIHMYLPSMYEVLLYEGKHVTVSGGLNNNLYLLRCMIKIIILHKVRYMYTSNWSIRNSLEVLSHIQLHVRKKGNVQTNCMTKKRWKRKQTIRQKSSFTTSVSKMSSAAETCSFLTTDGVFESQRKPWKSAGVPSSLVFYLPWGVSFLPPHGRFHI